LVPLADWEDHYHRLLVQGQVSAVSSEEAEVALPGVLLVPKVSVVEEVVGEELVGSGESPP